MRKVAGKKICCSFVVLLMTDWPCSDLGVVTHGGALWLTLTLELALTTSDWSV